MDLKPYQNALLAALYIICVVQVINFFQYLQGVEDISLIPIMMISLLTLSVTVMGFLFGYKPVTMYLDGQKKEAVSYFMHTVGTFAACTLVFVFLYVGVALLA